MRQGRRREDHRDFVDLRIQGARCGAAGRGADIGIDSKVVYGDAVIPVGDVMMGGMSTFAGLFILNSALIEGARKALARGVTPPIYRSGNVEGGTALVSLERQYFRSA